MYNRYIRNDNGSYSRIVEEEPKQQSPPSGEAKQTPPHTETAHSSAGGPAPPPFRRGGDSLTGFLQNILDQLHLDHVDTGDLLLLGLLFFLFRENADEELLVALGLLLIL